MNLFILHLNVKTNAKYYCDQHLIKMPLEGVQMLYTTLYVLLGSNIEVFNKYKEKNKAPLTISGNFGYKPGFINHPVTKWIRKCQNNCLYTIKVLYCVCKEYEYRFDKKHNVLKHLVWLYRNLIVKLPKKYIFKKRKKRTKFALAMPDEHKKGNIIESMRDYYIAKANKYFKIYMKYTIRQPPKWLTEQTKVNIKMIKNKKVYILRN